MIATFTDFSITGPYLGQVHAAIQAQAPGVPIIDLFSDLPAFNIKAAAYLIPSYSSYLPADTVNLCVVDPGVGSDRRPVALQIDDRWYVGPDNGLLSMLQRRGEIKVSREITWQPENLSDSFHGRDLFAPVCAELAKGESLEEWSTEISTASLVSPDWPDELPEVIYIDHYGNAVTGIRGSSISRQTCLNIAGQACGYQRVFAEAPLGSAFWYENANGLVEIAITGGSVQAKLGIEIGMTIRVL